MDLKEVAKEVWAPFTKKYGVHPETYDLQARLIELKAQPMHLLGPDGANKQAQRLALDVQGTVDFLGEESEIIIPSPYKAYDPKGIPISIYKPSSCVDNPPIFVFFHGGGLVTMCRESVATPLKIIAMETGAIVLSVEYRLLPNKESPCAPFEDGVTATRWVLENKTAVGGTENSKVGLGGESSGGHITACVTNEVMGLDFQVMVYPVLDTTLSQESCKEFESAALLSLSTMKFFFEHSMDHIPNHETDPRYNPMARTNTETSPPALIISAELDILVGAARDYVEKLKKAGVPVQYEVVKGSGHAIFTSRRMTPTTSREAYDHVVKFIKSFM